MNIPTDLEIAQAIEGPHDPLGIELKAGRLAKLRDLKWSRLSKQEQGVRLCEARAVRELLTAKSKPTPKKTSDDSWEAYADTVHPFSGEAFEP